MNKIQAISQKIEDRLNLLAIQRNKPEGYYLSVNGWSCFYGNVQHYWRYENDIHISLCGLKRVGGHTEKGKKCLMCKKILEDK